jgi:hypothetical protein
MGWLFTKLFGLGLIVAGVVLEVLWVGFLFGSVLGIVLLLIFAPAWFFAPLTLSVMGIALLAK